MKTYTFTLKLEGYGDNPRAAWLDAIMNLPKLDSMDPGEEVAVSKPFYVCDGCGNRIHGPVYRTKDGWIYHGRCKRISGKKGRRIR
jgi:hypothetical protein